MSAVVLLPQGKPSPPTWKKTPDPVVEFEYSVEQEETEGTEV